MRKADKRANNRLHWVDFPEPSPPSKVMNIPRERECELAFIEKRHSLQISDGRPCLHSAGMAIISTDNWAKKSLCGPQAPLFQRWAGAVTGTNPLVGTVTGETVFAGAADFSVKGDASAAENCPGRTGGNGTVAA